MRCIVSVVLVLATACVIGQTSAQGGKIPIKCTKRNEVYACGSACQTECKTLNEDCPIINIKCNDACYCISGYARDNEGKCIPVKDCPPKICGRK